MCVWFAQGFSVNLAQSNITKKIYLTQHRVQNKRIKKMAKNNFIKIGMITLTSAFPQIKFRPLNLDLIFKNCFLAPVGGHNPAGHIPTGLF